MRTTTSARSVTASCVVLLAGCMPSIEPIVSCEAHGNAQPLCGYQNPEDLVADLAQALE